MSVSATESRFDCTFDDDDYCGYSDESDGPVRWLRSKAHEYNSPGRHGVYANTGTVCQYVAGKQISVSFYSYECWLFTAESHISPFDTCVSSGVHDQLCHSFLPSG